MSTPFHPDHPHYAVHKEYIQGFYKNPDNPPIVQVKVKSNNIPGIPGTLTDFCWIDSPPLWWDVNREYKIKPRSITRTVTYPEPMRKLPELGSKVWFIICDAARPISYTWTNNNCQAHALSNGMCFATEADAQACYDALYRSEKWQQPLYTQDANG